MDILFDAKSTYTIRFLEGYQGNFPNSDWETRHFGRIVRWLVKQLGFVDVLLFDDGFEVKVKYNIGQTEFINQKSIGETTARKHFFNVKDVEMVYIIQSDPGTFLLIFKDDNSTNNAWNVVFKNWLV